MLVQIQTVLQKYQDTYASFGSRLAEVWTFCVAFKVVFLVLSRHKKMMEYAKVITKVYALILDRFS